MINIVHHTEVCLVGLGVIVYPTLIFFLKNKEFLAFGIFCSFYMAHFLVSIIIVPKILLTFMLVTNLGLLRNEENARKAINS